MSIAKINRCLFLSAPLFLIIFHNTIRYFYDIEWLPLIGPALATVGALLIFGIANTGVEQVNLKNEDKQELSKLMHFLFTMACLIFACSVALLIGYATTEESQITNTILRQVRISQILGIITLIMGYITLYCIEKKKIISKVG